MTRLFNKKGNINIFIPLGIILLITIFVAIFLAYYQVNIIADNIRKDLFYISNNAILAFNQQDLAYGKYTLDEQKAKEIIEEILNKNYQNGSVLKISIIQLDQIENNQILIKIKVRFKSFITLFGRNQYEFIMTETVKISLMKYN